jgi:uracil-DNA glycosylase
MTPIPILTKLRTLNRTVQSCSKCDISRFCTHKVTHRIHNPHNRTTLDILFLGEAPGESEYVTKIPFIGPAGEFLNTIIEEAINPHISYCITNAVWCVPYTDISRSLYRTPFLSEIQGCGENVAKLINLIKPKHFIALGTIAEKSLKHLKIVNYCKITHPSAIMQSSKSSYEFDNAILTIKQYLSRSI